MKSLKPSANCRISFDHLLRRYKYATKFIVPKKCTSGAELNAQFAADNSATVFLDGNPIATTPCLNTCFKSSQAPVSLSIPSIPAGPHTLEIDVVNNEGPSGLIVKAKLTRKCP